MSGKRCPGCGEVKAVEAFSRNKSKKDGLKSQCKDCDRRYREKNHEAIREYNHRYRVENREVGRECQRRSREKNHEAALERCRRYYEENREAVLEYHRRYYVENREALLEDQRRHREAMRDMTREVATRGGEPYTPAEDAHILTSNEPDAAIAVELGRTMESIRSRRKRLRKAVTA